MVFESGVISQHISSVVVFVAIFINLQAQTLLATHLIWVGSFLTGIAYIFWDFYIIRQLRRGPSIKRTYVRNMDGEYRRIIVDMGRLFRETSRQKRHILFHHAFRPFTYSKDADESDKR